MQPRTLDQVLASLGSVYDPQVNSIRQQQSALPTQLQNDESALQGKQNQAFDQILGGARARGVGFSGIPLGEQAKYTANTYMPALANMRTSYQNNARSLEDAIAQINERRATQGQSIYQYEQDFAESKRRYDEQAAQQAAAARAAAIAGGGFSPTTGGGGNGGKPAAPAPDKYGALGDLKKQATNALLARFKKNDVAGLAGDIKGMTESAKRGNIYDQFKLEMLQMYMKNSPYGNLIKQAYSYKPTSSVKTSAGGSYPTVNQVIKPAYSFPTTNVPSFLGR